VSVREWDPSDDGAGPALARLAHLGGSGSARQDSFMWTMGAGAIDNTGGGSTSALSVPPLLSQTSLRVLGVTDEGGADGGGDGGGGGGGTGTSMRTRGSASADDRGNAVRELPWRVHTISASAHAVRRWWLRRPWWPCF
jgi:hypothetical protein